ncbi:MAG TPA: BadF/BadG/BcrA/BcrD ATPase family protein [Terriglobales bacterium]|nr:BadF/BadG/BcrA/BcrD ATPase family protein [Terriglobales bacterium]
MALFLGIDGGGTKTDCAIGDLTTTLGRFTAGTSKIHRVGRDAATNSLRAAIQGAMYAARCTPDQIRHSCVGLAGASQPEVQEWLQAAMKDLVSGGLTIVGDNVIAHESAFKGGPGVLVIAGTGSIAYGRNERGDTARAGGWGPIISDEGSGDWIGRAATAACLRALDTGTNTAMMGRILTAWGVTTREDIIRIVNSFPPPNFAALFPQVLAAADGGDIVAREVLTRAATELAQLARIVIRKLWPGDMPLKVAGSGGVIRNSTQIRQVMQNAIRAERHNAVWDDSLVDPTLGALYLARHAPNASHG